MRFSSTSSGMWVRLIVWGLTVVAWAVAVWGVWVPGQAVGTMVLGVDMAEAVKFLPAVRAGQVHVWREGFLLPQFTLSLFLSVHAWQRRWPFSRGVRALVTLLAVAVALSMLPPAWTPGLLRAPEWREQTTFILVALAAGVLAPVWRYLPYRLGDGVLLLLGLTTGVVVWRHVTRVWPEFEKVYHTSLEYGVGLWALPVGIVGLVLLCYLSCSYRVE